MGKENIPVILPSGTRLEGLTPVVFIGPNGAGKTQFGMAISNSSNGTRIPALRSLAFEPTIQPRPVTEARNEAENKINRYRSDSFRQADELNDMLSELKAEQADEAIRFRDAWSIDSKRAKPIPTRLDTFLIIWHQTFPGRTLDFSTHSPRVQSTLPGASSEPYQAHTMSDGERAAIYLITRVLRAPPGVIIVDEPEVHFHSLLARTFWDTLQLQRSDCRFVYVTHDLPFALSRRNAEIGIVKTKTTAEMVDRSAGIPPELIEDILGAASLSLVAKRIVFTEGVPGASLDAAIYGAWFQSPDTAVVPVGNCRAVQDAVRVFQQKIISNADPLGIVERDYWSKKYLDKLANTADLFLLPTHELEGLLCLPAVAAAVEKYRGTADAAFQRRYEEFESQIREKFVGEPFYQLLLERIKRDIDGQLDGLVNAIGVSQDENQLKKNLTENLPKIFSEIDGSVTFDQQLILTKTALESPSIAFLEILPGKNCLSVLLANLGITERRYIDIICAALQLSSNDEPKFQSLQTEIVQALTPHLPPR